MDQINVLIGFILVAAAVFFYYWLRPRLSRVPLDKVTAKKPWYFPFFPSRQVQIRLAEMKQEHRHKVREKEHQELLVELGLDLAEKTVSQDFQKVRELIRRSRMSHLWRDVPAEEKKAIEKLRELVGEGGMMGEEAGRPKGSRSAGKKVKSLTKRERDYLFAVLKRMAERR